MRRARAGFVPGVVDSRVRADDVREHKASDPLSYPPGVLRLEESAQVRSEERGSDVQQLVELCEGDVREQRLRLESHHDSQGVVRHDPGGRRDHGMNESVLEAFDGVELPRKEREEAGDLRFHHLVEHLLASTWEQTVERRSAQTGLAGDVVDRCLRHTETGYAAQSCVDHTSPGVRRTRRGGVAGCGDPRLGGNLARGVNRRVARRQTTCQGDAHK